MKSLDSNAKVEDPRKRPSSQVACFFPKHGFLSGLVTPGCGSEQGAPPVSIEAVCVVVWRAVWSSVEQCGAVEQDVSYLPPAPQMN